VCEQESESDEQERRREKCPVSGEREEGRTEN